MLKAGKKYWWSVCGVRREGLFTGNYDKRTGNAILSGRSGSWSVPVEKLTPVSKETVKERGIKHEAD